VACGEDHHTIEAVFRASSEGLVDVIMVGNKKKMEEVAANHGVNPSTFTIVDIEDNRVALKQAVKLVREGQGDILMKGLVRTPDYLRAILDKENGLVPPNGLLSHVTVLEIPAYHKLLVVSDVAVLVLPDLEQKIKMLGYAIEVAQTLGLKIPVYISSARWRP